MKRKKNSKQGLLDNLFVIFHFCRTRWFLRFNNRKKLELRQRKQLGKFLKNVIPNAKYYKSFSNNQLSELPYMDKAQMMENFAERNTCGIELNHAFAVAEQAEKSRDFKPTLGDITIGMSSGTSGRRGLFLVSKQERLQWAGILLAKTLPSALLKQIIFPWRQPLRIAFFLRANSNLYDTLGSRRIDFKFYDLLAGLDEAIISLNAQQPHALVAPATVLRHLALTKMNGNLFINPVHIVSVAEVLELSDCKLIEQAFGIYPHQIYQATEGFLAYTCSYGSLHLNESHIYVEREWLDDTKTRFQPVITDFSRSTQLIVRYRLNDILRVSDQSCVCGQAELTLAAIEGRSDEVLWLRSLKYNDSKNDDDFKPLYPDVIRRTMALIEPALEEYLIVQREQMWIVSFLCDAPFDAQCKIISHRLTELCAGFDLTPPQLIFKKWTQPTKGAKRRRIMCEMQ